jgi:L-alanine-DL-glutamate epimerase-like enolase superfamily enzyme
MHWLTRPYLLTPQAPVGSATLTHKVRSLLNETLKEGFRYFKLEVGGNIEDDKRKLEIARSVIGYDGVKLMVDAN